MSSTTHLERPSITGVVLAGGQARRMGGADKGLVEFRGKPLVAHALDAIRELADRVLISANRNREAYASFGYPVIADADTGFAGPLAGMLSAMKTARTPYVLVVPCDSPLMTGTLLRRLCVALIAEDADVAAAHDGQRLHPVFLLAKRSLMSDLEQFLSSGERKVGLWLTRHRLAVADYSDRPELFANVNTPGDLCQLESHAAGQQSS